MSGPAPREHPPPREPAESVGLGEAPGGNHQRCSGGKGNNKRGVKQDHLDQRMAAGGVHAANTAVKTTCKRCWEMFRFGRYRSSSATGEMTP